MKICKLPDCNMEHYQGGYCRKHLERVRRHGNPYTVLKKHTKSHPDKCTIKNCDNKYYANNFCKKHYERNHKYNDPMFTINGKDMEKHGLAKSSEYNTYHLMIKRCYSEKNNKYHRYGGRGITVCDRWRNSFIAFYDDMGAKPFPKAQIDRIDNDGNYEPDNCHWVNQTANMRNASNTKLTMFTARSIRRIYKKGEISQLTLSKFYKVSESTIQKIVTDKYWKENAV